MQGANYLFLIGAPKAGTSSLAATLGRHPGIVLARKKEPMYFTDFAERSWAGPGGGQIRKSLVTTRKDYEALFEDKPGAPWRLDASTDYLSCPAAIGHIAAFAGEPGTGRVQVAVLVRDPVERAISQFQHTVRDGFETGTLLEALSREEERRAAEAHPLFYHVERSRYATQIAAWRARFPDLVILDYHRLKDGTEVPDRLLRAIGLPPLGDERTDRRNESFVYRNRWLGMAMRRGPLLRMARRIVPRRLRAPVRRTLDEMNRTGYRANPEELAALRAALRDEIEACLADPGIPTDRWTLAVRG